MDKVFPQKFILYLNFKSEDLAKKYKWISKLFLLFFVYAFLADFLISAKLLTSYTFCEGNYIITTSVDCEIASAKETDIFTIKNAQQINKSRNLVLPYFSLIDPAFGPYPLQTYWNFDR